MKLGCFFADARGCRGFGGGGGQGAGLRSKQSGQKFDAADAVVQTASGCDMGPDLDGRATEARFQPGAHATLCRVIR